MDTPVDVHFHNGSDTNQLSFRESIIGAPQPAITAVSGTAGAAYTATEQALINNLVTTVGQMRTALRNLGITL